MTNARSWSVNDIRTGSLSTSIVSPSCADDVNASYRLCSTAEGRPGSLHMDAGLGRTQKDRIRALEEALLRRVPRPAPLETSLLPPSPLKTPLPPTPQLLQVDSTPRKDTSEAVHPSATDYHSSKPDGEGAFLGSLPPSEPQDNASSDFLTAGLQPSELTCDTFQQLSPYWTLTSTSEPGKEDAESRTERTASVSSEPGASALQIAVYKGDETMVKLLLSHGADARRLDSSGRTVLHSAARRGDGAMARLLLEQAVDPNVPDAASRTALFEAVDSGSEAVVQELLSHGALVNARDAHGSVPLHLAVASGSEAITVLLLLNGADINA